MQATELPMEWQKVSIGCPILDRTLHGGIPCGSLTELVGESSTAKTQLCLQLLLTVQLPIVDGGLEGSALYIFTENYFAFSRLRQLARPESIAARAKRRHLPVCQPTACPTERLDDSNVATPTKVNEGNRPKSFRSCFEKVRLQDGYSDSYDVYERPAKVPSIDANDESTTRSGGVADPCKNIYVQGLQTAEALLRYLDYAETLLSHPLRMPVRLLVIDSIAALFRSDFDNSLAAMKMRANLFFQISNKLKQLAEKYDVAIVVSNHVTDYFEPVKASRRDPAPGSTPSGVGSEVLMTSRRRVVPALGISWAHCVNTRLFLSRDNHYPNTIRRSMQVVFAPHLPNVSCSFLVDADGVHGLPGPEPSSEEDDYGERFDYQYLVDGAPTRGIAASIVNSEIDLSVDGLRVADTAAEDNWLANKATSLRN